MIRYSQFQPTAFDAKGAFLQEQQDWFVVPCARNRDSDVLSESNFYAALKLLGGESKTVQVCRFGHWCNGWFEIILVKPTSKRVTIAEQIEAKLADYLILDEYDYSDREEKYANEVWRSLPVSDRVDLCNRAGVSILAARHDYYPSDDSGSILCELTE